MASHALTNIITVAASASTRVATDTFLFERLLVHFFYQHVHVIRHAFQILP